MEQSVTYCNEISLMMFGFGDSHKPNPETVKLVESIVLKQLRVIVQEALKYWDGKRLKGEELIFLMRKSKWKMRRFVKYLFQKHTKTKYEYDENDINRQKKYYRELLEFIEKIDETGELTDLNELDEVKRERQLRADRISIALDEEKYLEFQKARCVSFNSRETSRVFNFQKLKAWIDPKQEIDFTNTALEVLSYYAYQTVAEIIDYALLVRMDSRRTNDPLKNLSDIHFTASLFYGDHKFNGEKGDYCRLYSKQPAISVSEITEVMRRVNTPQSGYLTFGGKLPATRYLFAL